jgi:uncharacterized protein (TIGR02421 family)
MSDFFRLKGIDKALHDATRKISFLAINPSNIDEEKVKVFADENYAPQFIYIPFSHDLDAVEDELNSVDDHDSLFGSLISEKRDLFIDKCEMMRRIGSPKFSSFARKVCGLPKESTLSRAAELVSLECVEEKCDINASAAVNLLDAEIKHYGFPYKVKQKAMSSLAAVSVSDQCVFIRKGASFSERYIRRLIAHEIGTHILRAENGREQPFLMFMSGFPGYLSTEEGLAVWNEERFGLLTNETMRLYAARCVAVEMAKTKSFSSIYKHFRGLFGDDGAFKLALRVKRGLSDTSKKGGFTKDFVYLEGYLAVKDFIDKGGSLNELYWGKIGIEHLPVLRQMTGISSPRFLPKNQCFLALSNF